MCGDFGVEEMVERDQEGKIRDITKDSRFFSSHYYRKKEKYERVIKWGTINWV